MVDVQFDFKALADAGSMLGSGAIVVCDDTTCMLDMALNAVRFYRNESCGKCVPCRVGSQKMVEILTRWTQGGCQRIAIRRGSDAARRSFSSHEPDFHLRPRPDRSRARFNRS